MSEPFDTIIVGAGAAGCVLANRLSEDPGRRVFLAEAGPDYGLDPAAWPAEMLDPTSVWPDSHSWGHRHAGRPVEAPLPLPRAKVMGGTTTVNGCVWLRGSAADYDEWAALGNAGWGFADLLPYFQRAESDPLGGPLAGKNGPVPVSRITESDLSAADRAFISAVESLGLPYVADLNETAQQRGGVGPAPKNIADGVRMNGAFTYLVPARSRSNLSIRPNTVVDRIELDAGRAIGIKTADGTTIGSRQVILCAGSYDSPAILLRSGIGPARHLDKHGIPIAVDLPGVGEHLLDHPLLAPDRPRPRLMRAECAPNQRSLIPLLVKSRSRHAGDDVDVHVYVGQDFSADHDAWFFWFSVSLQYARSRGRVKLTSADPLAPLHIDHAYLTEPADLDAICDGIELAERIVASPPMQAVLQPSAEQAPPWGDRNGLPAWAKTHVGTTFHPSSTCRMGPATDTTAVVDAAGRVYGVDGLRVVDASIFPTGPRANLHFTIVAAAEKIAQSVHDESN